MLFSFLPVTEAGALGGHSETNIFGSEMKMGRKLSLQRQLLREFKQQFGQLLHVTSYNTRAREIKIGGSLRPADQLV